MNRLLKALSALLGYPDAALRGALPEIAAVIGAADGLPRPIKAALAELIGEMAQSDPYELEAAYVALFDRGRATSLHLFEHVHGESRDRGQAMVSLRETYEQAGLTLEASELPDYLPAVLEYLAVATDEEARGMLADCSHILRAIGEALVERRSRYLAVFDALLATAGEPVIDAARAARAYRSAEKPMDEEWAEEPVIFGPAAGCTLAASCASGGAGRVNPVRFMPGPRSAARSEQ
jgi:nitrate reductase delta subunit